MNNASASLFLLQTLSSRFSAEADLTFDLLATNKNFSRDTFTSYAHKAAQQAKAIRADINIELTLAEILISNDESRVFALMTKAVKYLRVQHQEINTVERFLKHKYVLSNVMKRDRLFYILASLNAGDLLVKYGVSSTDKDVKMHAILSASAIKKPSSSLVGTLYIVATLPEEDHRIQNIALMAYSALLKGLTPTDAKLAANALISMLEKVSLRDTVRTNTLLTAISNAGPAVIPFQNISLTLMSLLNGRHILDVNLNAAVRRVLQSYKAHPFARQMMKELDVHVTLVDSDFPFNKSFTKDLLVGGNQFNLDLKGSYSPFSISFF